MKLADKYKAITNMATISKLNNYKQLIISEIERKSHEGCRLATYRVPVKATELIEVQDWLVSGGFTVNITGGYYEIRW